MDGSTPLHPITSQWAGLYFTMINLPIVQAEEVAESIQWIVEDKSLCKETHKDIIAAYYSIIDQLKVVKPDSYLLKD